MSSPIARQLIKLKISDQEFNFNLLGLADKNDMVTFSNKNHIKFQIKNSGHIYRSPRYLTGDAERLAKKLIDDGAPENILSNTIGDGEIGTIKKIYTVDECSAFALYHGTEFVHFISDSGQHALIFHAPWKAASQLKPIVSRKPTNGRIGRVIRRILNETDYKYADKDIEEFVNEFKSKFDLLGNIDSLFEIVLGDKLLHYYHYDQYENTSSCTLQGSCMRHEECQNYLSIYAENPGQVRLLILKSIAQPNKISARALLWKLEDGKTIMDRVYSSRNHEPDIFIDYAIKQGWYFKKRQDSSSNTEIVNSKDDDAVSLPRPITIMLKHSEFDGYPYSDTFKYLNSETGKISNQQFTGANGFLESVDGYLNEDDEECEYCGGSEEIECMECDGDGEEECPECYGSGQIECDECDGCGEVDCDECDGTGEVDCETCDGDAEVDCEECNGDGEIDGEECEECLGAGKIECPECYVLKMPGSKIAINKSTGKQKCGECSGKGRQECSECDGDCESECEDCRGRGEISCSECDGDGYRTCYEC